MQYVEKLSIVNSYYSYAPLLFAKLRKQQPDNSIGMETWAFRNLLDQTYMRYEI